MHMPDVRTFAVPDALEQIEEVLASLWAAHPHVPDIIRMRVGIAVAEVAANIIEHATKGLDRLVNVRVSAGVRHKDVVVTFVDDGIPSPGWNVATTDPAVMPGELAESGRGIPLAQAALSELRYERADEHNHWTLVSEVF